MIIRTKSYPNRVAASSRIYQYSDQHTRPRSSRNALATSTPAVPTRLTIRFPFMCRRMMRGIRPKRQRAWAHDRIDRIQLQVSKLFTIKFVSGHDLALPQVRKQLEKAIGEANSLCRRLCPHYDELACFGCFHPSFQSSGVPRKPHFERAVT